MGQTFCCNTCSKLVCLDYDIAYVEVSELDCYDCDRQKKFILDFSWFMPFELEDE
tara:strand:+ start:2481 stop:2645 length:165 start_codon:yes stop_codon:yes gene_type:complete